MGLLFNLGTPHLFNNETRVGAPGWVGGKNDAGTEYEGGSDVVGK